MIILGLEIYGGLVVLLLVLCTLRILRWRWFWVVLTPLMVIVTLVGLVIASDAQIRTEPRGINIKAALPMRFYLASPKLSDFSVPRKLYDFTSGFRR